MLMIMQARTQGGRGGSYEPPILMIENFLSIVRLLMRKYELTNVIHVLCVAYAWLLYK